MADQSYRAFPFIFGSRGIVARLVDDTTEPNQFLNLDNCEELYENSFSQRLGSTILNSGGTVGSTVYSLNSKVVSLYKLGGLAGNYWRYAGTADGKLWRRAGLTPGVFTTISSAFDGNPFWAVSYTGDFSGQPYMFFANLNGMFKDNGSLAAPQQMGIFQPQYPVQAQSQAPPTEVVLDDYTGLSTDYSYTGIAGGTISGNVSTTTTSAIAAPGLQAVTVANPDQISLFQLLTIDTGPSAEEVLVLLVNSTGFVANFTKAHALGVAVVNQSLTVTVPASTTATVSKAFGGLPIPVSETVYGNQADYIGLYVKVSDPNQIQSITIKFDCGDGTFNTDYFFKVVAQGPLQSLISAGTNNQDPTTALTDAVLSESLNLYGPDGIGQLNTGLDSWTPLLFQLSDFSNAGRADYGDPTYNWANVNGYRVEIVTNDTSSATVDIACLVLFGGAGPDSLGGVGYDWRVTFFNAVDGTESNGCPVMTNQNPPNATNWVYPRRQPVLLTINIDTWAPGNVKLQDSQITHLRIYRRGGSLGDNWRYVDKLAINIAAGGTVTYTDTAPDVNIAGNDLLSLTHDVPVTSTLPVPVDTTLVNAITTQNQQVNVYPVDMSNISVRQIVTLGSPSNIENNFETVIVLKVFSDHFTAFVQNKHAIGEAVQATATTGKPVTLMATAYNQFFFAGDEDNPNDLYWSNVNPQYVSAAAHKPISTPDDIVTAVVSIKGNLYVSTIKGGWWAVAPGSNGGSPTIYPTACKHGAVSRFGNVSTEEGIYYQAVDGQRFFGGGPSAYLTQNIEFIYQGVGTTPMAKADQTKLGETVMAYWNNMVFNAYTGEDGNRHRIIWHSIYKRFRNDSVDAQCMNLESDSEPNVLLWGDSTGLIHMDRQDIAYDQIDNAGVVAQGPIAINLQSSYQNQGSPANQKNYNNLQMDVDTNGQNITLDLLFNDGASTLPLGNISAAGRQKVNVKIQNGDGYQAYKVALKITGNLTQRVYIYQASMEALVLPMTRKAIDTYWLKLGNDFSKFAKNVWWEYTAKADITFDVFYDDSSVSSYTFSLPANTQLRNAVRTRLPAISFRMIRIVGTSTDDFMIWPDSAIEYKPQAFGKGYALTGFVTD